MAAPVATSSINEVTPRRVALITGASAGIGLELAKQFAKYNHDLVLIARREQALASLAAELSQKHNVHALVFACDLSSPEAPSVIHAFTSQQQIAVDVLVNNAGFGANGAFVKLPAQRQLEMIQVNIAALVALSHLYLPDMLAAPRAGQGILNIASTAAFAPGPFMSVYYATKAFVLSFSEALSNEFAGTGITICCLCPGATASEFQTVANLSHAGLFHGPNVMSAEEVARIGYEGFAAGKKVVIAGLFNQLAAFSTRFLPRETVAQVARRLQEPREV